MGKLGKQLSCVVQHESLRQVELKLFLCGYPLNVCFSAVSNIKLLILISETETLCIPFLFDAHFSKHLSLIKRITREKIVKTILIVQLFLYYRIIKSEHNFPTCSLRGRKNEKGLNIGNFIHRRYSVPLHHYHHVIFTTHGGGAG